MSKQVHEFLGEYILLCARVDHWMTNALKHGATKSQRACKAHLLGEKLQGTSDLVTSNPEIFSNPKSVSKLLKQFKPFAILRSELAHGVLTMATSEVPIFAFRSPVSTHFESTGHFWITSIEAADLLSKLRQLTKQFYDQTLRP